MSDSEKLGGPGKIVEFDESKFGRQKYDRDYYVDGQWIFGEYKKKCFLIMVSNRTEYTLVPLIKKGISPETILF